MSQLNHSANTFLLQKKQKFSLELFDGIVSQDSSNLPMALALQVNLESLGFAFHPNVIQTLSHLTDDSLGQVWGYLKKVLSESVGAHQMFKPMYPNFPRQVQQASDTELLVNAFMHYSGDWLGVRILPHYEKQARLPLVQNTKPRVLSLGTGADLDVLFVQLLNANTSLSETDKAGVATLIDFYSFQHRLNDFFAHDVQIVQKETLAFVGAKVMGKIPFENLSNNFNTVTDVLRLAVAMSDGDVSLSQNTKFQKMSRPVRRELLALVETVLARVDTEQALENAFTYRNQWVRLGEKLHPQEFATRYAATANLFHELRNNPRPTTFNALVDNAMERVDLHQAIELLAQRPGVFARNLNRLFQHIEGRVKLPIRPENVDSNPFSQLKDLFPGKNVVSTFDNRSEYSLRALDAFEHATAKISTPVLLQVMNYFKNQEDIQYRAFLPKGVVSKAYVVENNVEAISEPVRQSIVKSCEDELMTRFAALPSLGKTYINPELEGYPVPFALRSASKALKTVTRGSKMAMEDSDTTRFFIWWHEHPNNRVDIDLSVMFLDESFQRVDHCSFTNIRGMGFSHSGDITSAPKGACEFIDINKSELNPRIQYAVMMINSYTSQNYSDLPECFAGWMNRDIPQRGEIFDAKTVQNKVDLTSESQTVMPMIVDVKNNQVIWADLVLKTGNFWNMVEYQSNKISDMVKSMVHLTKPNLYDLFTLHAKARGEIVENREEANSVFSIHEGVTPYQTEVIAADYMAERPEPAVVLKPNKV